MMLEAKKLFNILEILGIKKKPFDVHELPYAIHLGNDKQMGFLAGTSHELRLKQGHNKIEDMFYLQLTHFQTKDQMRVWLTIGQFESFIINCNQILRQEKKRIEEEKGDKQG